jgi:phosphomannomutase
MLIKSISGVRFELKELEHNPTMIKDYAKAFASWASKGNIAIARDGRPSGIEILKQLTDELIQLGRDVVDLGIVPTPTLQMYVKNKRVVGGICITASHNNENWNGLKFINSSGNIFDEQDNEKLKNEYNNLNHQHKTKSFGTLITDNKAIENHISFILELEIIKQNVNDNETIIDIIKNYSKKNNVKFVIDAVNSAGSEAVPMLLDRFECEYEKLYCDSSGIFPHNPEPLPENLTALCNFIKQKNKAGEKYIGIAVDPDADRLVLVDEEGDCIGEEKTICIAIDAYYTLMGSKEKVVVNQSTTMLADWVAKKHNVELVRSAVGEANVVKMMENNSAKIGGEGSGGVILADCHYGRDSLVGITLLLCLLSKKDITLKELVSAYPQYSMLKKKYDFDINKKEELYKKMKDVFAENEISDIDGIKINYDKGWGHLRASNTEDIVRIISEAENIELAKKYLENIEKELEM